ncbi:hypothetical protein Tco_1111304 [Tanacetum coccineum]|uniref:Uncharacterized protein n=1 Tax=Tanacetum coccineum TaxID=301880 RepID=A0ABQ5IMI3_9ASTR
MRKCRKPSSRYPGLVGAPMGRIAALYVMVASTLCYRFKIAALLLSKSNETAAWEYAQSMIGLPYGYHNLIFSWIDTISDNYPPLLNANLVASVMTVWNQMQPAYAANMWNEALNKRLGTKIRYEGANSGGAKPNQTTLNLEAHLLSPSGPCKFASTNALLKKMIEYKGCG